MDKKSKISLFDRILRNPERILVSFGLLFIAAIILVSVYRNESSEIFTSPFTGQEVAQEEWLGSAIIDLNTAEVEELTKLHGIGEELATRIIEYREEHGSFQSVDELLSVKGIGESKLEELRYYVVCTPASEP